jgi:hypothetical protein
LRKPSMTSAETSILLPENLTRLLHLCLLKQS